MWDRGKTNRRRKGGKMNSFVSRRYLAVGAFAVLLAGFGWLFWRFFVSSVTVRPWCLTDAPAKVVSPKSVLGATPLVARGTSTERVCVIEGSLSTGDRVDADLYLLENGKIRWLSGLGAGRSGGEVSGPLAALSRLTIQFQVTTFQTTSGHVSVLVGQGFTAAAGSDSPIEYSPFKIAFRDTLSGRVQLEDDFVVYAGGDHKPRLAWGMDVDRFAAENTVGSYLVVTLGHRR
jgi:hypothetical protein